MNFESQIFDEPELEFGDRHHHPDPRLGLFESGPLQPYVGEVIKIAVVGSAKTVEDTRKFLSAATAGFGAAGAGGVFQVREDEPAPRVGAGLNRPP